MLLLYAPRCLLALTWQSRLAWCQTPRANWTHAASLMCRASVALIAARTYVWMHPRVCEASLPTSPANRTRHSVVN